MSNQTAQQYQQVANTANEKVAALTKEIDSLDQQRRELQRQAAQVLADTGDRKAEKAILDQQKLVVNQRNELLQQRAKELNVAQVSESSAEKAESNPLAETNTPPVNNEPIAEPPSSEPSGVGAATSQKYNLAADQAQQRSTELESNIKETIATRKDLQNQAIDAAAAGDLAKEAQIKQQIVEVDKEFVSLNQQLAQSDATRDRAQNLANASADNPNAQSVPAPVETLQAGSGGNVLSADGNPVQVGAQQVPTPVSSPAKIETDADQEARFEQERLAAVVARNQDREDNPNQPVIITQGPPQGSGIPAIPYNDGDPPELNPGWVAGPDGTVAYVGTSITTPEPQKSVDPTFGGTGQVFDDGSTIQTFDDGSVLATGADGSTSALTTEGKSSGITGQKQRARSSGQSNAAPIKNQPDWRVRLQLAQRADYLYLAKDPGILKPLQSTSGILFPYLPSVSVGYTAAYDNQSLTHTNYRVLQYTNSTVDNIQVSADFTAQSTEEANYLLAVIHFMRTITKMFYGQDQNPIRGTPPPLVYLTGYGEFQYNRHPLVITSFTYTLPTDVDYIRADSQLIVPGTPSASDKKAPSTTNQSKTTRQETSKVPAGGYPLKPQWQKPAATDSVTYVPTKISMSFSGIPVVSRSDISREFSVRDFATGKLTSGKNRPQNRGLW